MEVCGESVDAGSAYCKSKPLNPRSAQPFASINRQQAIDDDPTCALAYAGLADAYRSLSIVGHVPSKEAFPHQDRYTL
jgi:hypothetical protein